MQQTNEKFLPIGTVVILKGAKKRVMITGFCVSSENMKEKMWDYGGCLYPEGILDSSQSCAFNHDQIEHIFHYGLIDDEEVEFRQQLKQIESTVLQSRQSKTQSMPEVMEAEATEDIQSQKEQAREVNTLEINEESQSSD